MLLPIVIIFVILAMGRSAMRAALMGIFAALGLNLLSLIVVYILRKHDQLKYKMSIPLLFEIMVETARMALPVIAACAAAGIISGVFTLTGLGLHVTGAILHFARNMLVPTIVFCNDSQHNTVNGTAHNRKLCYYRHNDGSCSAGF